MENLIFSINVVLPISIMMLLGAFLRYIKIFDEDFLKKANKFAFKVLLPNLMFYNIYKSDISETVNVKIIIFAVSLALVIIGVSFIIVMKFDKSNKNRGILIQGLYRSNFILFGVPVSKNLFGEANLAVVTTLVAIIIPLYNFMAVIILDFFSSDKSDYKKTIFNIITNPLIIGSLLGILFSSVGIKLPNFVEEVVDDLAGMASPLALMVLGGQIQIKNISKNIRNIIFVTVGRLIVIPAIALTLSILSGYRGVELGALLSMFTPSCAVSGYTMAQEYDCNSELAGQLVFVTTLFSPFTMFVFIYLLKTFNFI